MRQAECNFKLINWLVNKSCFKAAILPLKLPRNYPKATRDFPLYPRLKGLKIATRDNSEKNHDDFQ